MRLEVQIPIKTYLIKFLAKNNEIEPFLASTGKCHFSSIILDPLKKDFVKDDLKLDEGKYQNLRVSLPLGENRFWFDKTSILRINQRLQSMFNQQLCDMVSITNERKGDIFFRVQQFCDYFQIGEDDLKFDAVIKMYYRARYGSNKNEMNHLIKLEQSRNQQLSLFSN